MSKRGPSLALLLPILLLMTALPGGASSSERCTLGDAQALFQELPLAFNLTLRAPDQVKLVDTFAECQYRFYQDGETIRFSQDDFFVGGLVVFLPYKELGWTRQHAISILEGSQVRTWLAESVDHGVIGEPVEQPLMRTAYKDFMASPAGLGLIVFQHRGFITQLPAGEYLSITEATFPEIPELGLDEDHFTWTVRLVITPEGTAP